jgi:hypothetical protein
MIHSSVCDSILQGAVRYQYISIIDRLRGFYSNGYLSQKLAYRQDRTDDPGKTEDIFDGEHFKTLLGKTVTWNGSDYRSCERYFNKDTDLALGLSTDGTPLQKHTKLDTWPLLLTMYSLPPELRYRKEYQPCCGLIPGMRFPPLQRNWRVDTHSPLISILYKRYQRRQRRKSKV